MKEKFYDFEKIKKRANQKISIKISQRNLCPAAIKNKKFTYKFKNIDTYFIVLDVLYLHDEKMVFGILFEPIIQQELYWDIPYQEFIEKFNKGEIKLWKKEN